MSDLTERMTKYAGRFDKTGKPQHGEVIRNWAAEIERLRATNAEAHVILQSWVLASEDLSAEGISSLRATADHEHECFLAAKAWCQKVGPVTLEEATRYRTALTNAKAGPAGMKPVASYPNAFPKTNAKEK